MDILDRKDIRSGLNPSLISAIKFFCFRNQKEFWERYLIGKVVYSSFAKAMAGNKAGDGVGPNVVIEIEIVCKRLRLMEDDAKNGESLLMFHVSIGTRLMEAIQAFRDNPRYANMDKILDLYDRYKHYFTMA